MNTKSIRKEDVEHSWYLLDAEDQILGRFASVVANKLRGKDKPTYTPHVDNGDFIVVINAKKIRVTGNKFEQKKYYRHSLYPGGLKTASFKEKIDKDPESIILKAVKGMLPKNKLSNQILKKLKVYSGDSHPHEAQNPIPIKLNK
tara:strand:- start:277 stop:711 length:435 start_codon:yes stop_codon:yes gene_type:complete